MLSDQQARLIALDPTKSFIVQAPAGSGKTSLLVSRFINLIQNCKSPEECLAITFTKKAALEMRNRVLQTINKLISEKIYQEDHIYKQIIANPNRLQILTIDAFCGQLIQKMPVLSRFGVDFTIAEDPELLYQKAVEQLLGIFEFNSIKNSEVLQDYENLIKLYQYFANDHELIYELLKNLLYKREQWLPLIVPINLPYNAHKKSDGPDPIRLLLEKNLQVVVAEILSNIDKILPPVEIQNQILKLANYAASNIENSDHPLSKLKHSIDSWPKPSYLHLSSWQAIASLLLNQDGSPKTIVTSKQGFNAPSKIKSHVNKKIAATAKSDMQALLQLLRTKHLDFLLKLSQINNLPATTYQENNWKILATLFSLLPRLVAYLMLIFKEYKQVDFIQVAIAALQAMGDHENPSDLSFILEYKLKHILIDEFQDTSILQYKLLEKIIANWENHDGRTIFIVGDPMQSIYSFRQADVRLFLQVQQFGIANLQLNNLFLTTNFRSSGNIVNNLNNLFVNIFPAENDINSGGVKYSASTYSKKLNDSLQDPNLNFFQPNNDVQFILTQDVKHEAEQIINLIQYTKKIDPNLQIAILFRSRAHSVNIINKLQQHHINYQSNELERFNSKNIIIDLYMLLRAILHLNDRIGWLALLRGPLVGLRLIDLNNLFEFQADTPLFDCLSNYKINNALSIEAKDRLNYIFPILLQAINLRENIDLADLLKKTWISLGGNLLYDSKDLYLVENFLFNLSKIQDIHDFSSIEKLINQSISLISHNIDPNAIQLMTIHKAKGLEFDVIIVPSMNKAGNHSKNSLLLWEERSRISVKHNFRVKCLDHYLLFAPLKSSSQQDNSIYDFMKSTAEQKEIHEAKRLLYVAISRSKKKFYGFINSTNYAHKSFAKFLEPYIQSEQLIELNQTLEVPNPEDLVDSFISINNLNDKVLELYRLPITWYI